MKAEDMARELVEMLEQTAREQGQSLHDDATQLAEFIADSAEHLQRIVGQAGFGKAVQAEADRVALRAAGRAVAQGDAADQRLVGIIAGALRIGAVALAA